MKKIFWTLCLVGALSACSGSQQKDKRSNVNEPEILNDGHNARNSVDYAGEYTGTLPVGAQTNREINLVLGDSTYVLRLAPLKENEKTTVWQGKFSWDNSGSIITLEGVTGTPNRYFVGEGRLFQLDENGKRRTEADEEKYVLYLSGH